MKRTIFAALALTGVCTLGAAQPKPELPLADYEKLILAFKDVSFNAKDLYRLDSRSEAAKALVAAQKQYALPKATFVDGLLKHEAAGVRAKAVEMLSGGFFGTTQKSRDAAVALMATEKDAGVRAALLRTFCNDGGKNPAIGAFILAALNDSDAVIRDTAAVFCTSTWNAKVPGFVEKLADLIVNDPDAKVRADVAGKAGALGNDLLVPAFEKAFADADEKVQVAAFKGALDLWWNFPTMKTASEAGYRLTLKRLGELKPDGALATAYFSPFGSLAMKVSPRARAAWEKNTAGFYKAEEVRAALLPFAKSDSVSFLVRNAAFKALYAHGLSKEDVTALAEEVKPTLKKFDADALTRVIQKDLK